jgi:hemolysin D
MARQRETDFKALTDQGFMSGHAGQDRTRERIEQERDLATQQARLAEAQAASRETTLARAAYLAEIQRALSERQAQAILKRQQFTQELNKAQQRSRLTQLTAPVDGTVQQKAVHTEGGVATEAQVLMVIVPHDADVTAEVVVDNKDIGFVNAGQHATIKLETFPYTRYGTVDATVASVTADAVADEKRGAIFPATLRLGQDAIDVDGKRIRLSPGMNITAEIKTGERRVIDYLLSPVQKAVGESLRER